MCNYDDVANKFLLNTFKNSILFIKFPFKNSYLLCRLISSNWLIGIDLAKYGENDPQIRRFSEIIFSGHLNNELIFPKKNNVIQKLTKNIKIKKKWACIHSRSSEYSHNNQKGMLNCSDFSQENRNTSINNFILTIKYLIENNFTVFVMGENNNINIISEDLILYENENWKSEQLNIEIIQTADLFIGSQSGLSSVAQMAGVPTIISNYTTYSHCYNNSRDTLVIPKLIMKPNSDSFLTITEIIRLGIFEERNSEIFKMLNLRFQENTQEDILVLVQQLLHNKNDINKEVFWKNQQKKILTKNNLLYYYSGIELSSYINYEFCEKYKNIIN